MNVLMVGVDDTSLGGMLTVINNYRNNEYFCKQTNLKYIPATIHSNKLMKLFFSLNAIRKIKHLLKKKEINIVHVHMSDGLSAFREGYIMKMAKEYGCKTVCHIHAADYETWFYKLNDRTKKRVVKLLECSDVILALGEKWKQIFQKIVPETRIEVLYNAVPTPTINQYNSDSNNVIFLGHMIKRKGIDDFLDAIKEIDQDIPDRIKFRLYGADREGTINRRISVRQLDKKVEYCGWLKDDEKEAVFTSTLLNVLPSYNEGLPMSILETMAYGIPNISTNIAAIPEAIESGRNGYLINPGDIESLSTVLKEMINNGDLRSKISSESYDTICNRFNLDRHINRLLYIYKELVRE